MNMAAESFLEVMERNVREASRIKAEHGLSIRAAQVMVNYGMTTREQVRAMKTRLIKLKGVGPKTAAELTTWAFALVTQQKGNKIRITPSHEHLD